jgi:predicted TIM-barrel fold metal-dependent hydrolase
MYKKLGADKVMFASDSPYFTFTEALSDAKSFFKRHSFSERYMRNVFYENAVELLNLR